MDKDLKSKTFGELERLVVGLGQKKYTAGYIFGFIHTRGIRDISEITPLSKSFRSRLVEQGYYISKLLVLDKLTDPDGTVKYIFGLPASALAASEAGSDDKKVESVLLFDPVKSKRFPGLSPGNSKGISQGDGRRTLCISTQVGCSMGCVFCATGKLGFARNLTAGEIVDQVNIVANCQLPNANFPPSGVLRITIGNRKSAIGNRITNVVFMGMGEPLANYDAVLDAVRILNHPQGRKIGIRHITISTCGLPEVIERLADEDIQPRLAISLNAPTDAIRRQLMPVAKKYPLGQLFRAVELYQHKTHNRVTFEYCLIKGVNDTVLHARLLVKRLRPVRCNVNLIDYNPPLARPRPPRLAPARPGQKAGPHAGCNLRPSGTEAVERFAKVLSAAGLETTIRQKMGQTINAACGQLGAGW